MHVGGLLIPDQEDVTWQDINLSVGDDVRIRVLETDEVDAPTERFSTSPEHDIQAQKRYLRMMAEKFGWEIRTKPNATWTLDHLATECRLLGFFVLTAPRSQTQVVACPTHTHVHVLCNLALKIAFSVFKRWLPFVNILKSPEESANAFSV